MFHVVTSTSALDALILTTTSLFVLKFSMNFLLYFCADTTPVTNSKKTLILNCLNVILSWIFKFL
ncbi:hypothetical protein EI424_03395 [Tenacibaculum singaporense]|nr:hypothetical protein EI424_03395 [Tenacibaculum singaporense]